MTIHDGLPDKLFIPEAVLIENLYCLAKAALNYKMHERLPSVSEHQFLWESVGWGNINTEMSEGSLSNSLYGVVVTVNDKPIGMGRIVGDGFMFFYIQDVVVLPSFQGLGLGKEILEYLLDYIKKRRIDNAIIDLRRTLKDFYEEYHKGGTVMSIKILLMADLWKELFIVTGRMYDC